MSRKTIKLSKEEISALTTLIQVAEHEGWKVFEPIEIVKHLIEKGKDKNGNN